MIFKLIGLYFLAQIASTGIEIGQIAVCLHLGINKILKSDRFIPLSIYVSIFSRIHKSNKKQMKERNKSISYIPFVKNIRLAISLKKTLDETLNSEEFQKSSHLKTSIEKMRIEAIKEDTKFHIINRLRQLEEMAIVTIDYDNIVSIYGEDKRYYAINGRYSNDEIQYLAFATRKKLTLGEIDGAPYAILDAVDVEEIKELFPNFIPIQEEDIKEEIKAIFMTKPDEADICYTVSSILYNRFMPKDLIDEYTIKEERPIKLIK